MENKINALQGWLWFGLTCVLAVWLAVNTVLAIAGVARLQYWNYCTLTFFYFFTEAFLTEEQRRLIVRTLNYLRNKVTHAFRRAFSRNAGRFRALAALFNANKPKIQTEP